MVHNKISSNVALPFRQFPIGRFSVSIFYFRCPFLTSIAYSLRQLNQFKEEKHRKSSHFVLWSVSRLIERALQFFLEPTRFEFCLYYLNSKTIRILSSQFDSFCLSISFFSGSILYCASSLEHMTFMYNVHCKILFTFVSFVRSIYCTAWLVSYAKITMKKTTFADSILVSIFSFAYVEFSFSPKNIKTVTNNSSFPLYEKSDSAFTERILGMPNENYKGYVEADATTRARHIPSNSLFLMHGLADITAPNLHGIQLARSLTEAGTLFRYHVSSSSPLSSVSFYDNQTDFISSAPFPSHFVSWILSR